MRFLTAGESHGRYLTAVIDNIPAGLEIKEEDINFQLQRRQRGFGRGPRQKIEKDRVEILSGLRYGKTTGAPLTLQIKNKDWENWKEIMGESVSSQKIEKITSPRPGHADLVGIIKYGLDDIRDVIERASARETAIRVAVGAVARELLTEMGIKIYSWVIQIGDCKLQIANYRLKDYKEIFEKAEKSPLRCPDKSTENKMIKLIEKTKKEGNTLGGVFEVVSVGVPIGLGSYTQWDKRLSGRIVGQIMSIPAIKGVEIGGGFALSGMVGTQAHDEIFYDTTQKFFRKTNYAGGLEGGITNGEPLVIRAVMKPISTTKRGLKTVDLKTKKEIISRYERSDICAVPSAAVIAEAVLAIEIMNACQEKFGGDFLEEMKKNYRNYLEYVKNIIA